MPGKVNPVIPEVVNQVAFQIIGGEPHNHSSCRGRPTAAQRGAGDRLQYAAIYFPLDERRPSLSRKMHRRDNSQCGAVPRLFGGKHGCRDSSDSADRIWARVRRCESTLMSGQKICDVLQSELHLSPDLFNQLRAPSTRTKPWKAHEFDV